MKSGSLLCMALTLIFTAGGCEMELTKSFERTPGVAITSISVPSICVQGDTVRVVAHVENRGNSRENIEVVLMDATEGIEIGRKSLTLSAAGSGEMDEISDMILPSPTSGSGWFGAEIDRGDVDGDGYTDLLIGAHIWNNEKGRVYLYYGGPSMDANPDKVFEGENAGDRFGQDVCLGDVNGDGYDDVIVGAVGYNNWRGRVYMFFGGPDMDLKCDLTIDGETGTSGRYGRAIDTGDTNNDGYEDLLITAPRSDAESWQGRAYLYYGGSPMDTSIVKVFNGENDRDLFGVVAAIGGDVDGDGYADILVGNCAPWLSNRQGRAYLYYGGPGTSMDTVSDITFCGDEIAGDDFASCVDLFDIDSDGHADVLISARTWPRGAIQGRVYLYWGSDRATMDYVPDVTFTGEADAQANFGGNTVHAGFVNDDKYGDIIVGAYSHYRLSGHGRAYLFYGGSKKAIDAVYDRAFEENVELSAVFGKNAAMICDLNGDGLDDMVLGAYAYNNGQGQIWVYHNAPPSATDISVNWNTTKVSVGNHILKVEISPVGAKKDGANGAKITTVDVKSSEDIRERVSDHGEFQKSPAKSTVSNDTMTPAMGKPIGSLTLAAVDGDMHQLELHLARGTDINEKTISGDTALHYAIKYRHREVAELLIAKGADVNSQNRDGENPAHLAIKANQKEVLDLLIAKGATVSSVHLAAYRGDPSAVKSFLKKGIPVNAMDDGGLTLLHAAASGNQKEVVEYLIGHGADVNPRDKKRQTPLFCAATAGHQDVVELLINKGADINPPREPDRWTPLYAAVNAGYKGVVALLVSKGGDVNAKAITGETPLHAAALKGERDIAALLIEHDANINAARWGNTPLHLAVAVGHENIVELLATKGADLNTNNSDGFAPLHYAVSRGRLSWWETQIGDSSTPSDLAIVQLLVTYGADVNAKSNDGRSPMDIALAENRTEMVELLLARGAMIPSIHTAAKMGDVNSVRAFVEKGGDVNAKDKDGQTALHVAAGNSQKDVAELLISKGADLNAKDGKGYTPLFYTIWSDDANMVGLLVSKGADVNFTPEKDYPPLHHAVWFENPDMARVLVDHGARFDVKDQQGWTAFRYAAAQGNRDIVDLFIAKGADISGLHMAACAGNLARVKSLVEQGADVNAKDELGWTPLYWAASMGRTDVAEFLVAKGADVQAKTNDEQTALQQAAQTGVARLVDLLVSKGADVKAKDKHGKTPLHAAAAANGSEVTELLITKGADVNAKTTNDWTPLHMAALAGNKEVVELLIAKGADVNAKNKQGRTPLSLAEARGHKEIAALLRKYGARPTDQIQSLHKAVADHDIAQVKSLLSQGIDVNAKDEAGDTPLHCAAKIARDAGKDVCELLIASGASVNATNKVGWTPLHAAAEFGNLEVARLLIADGADVNARDSSGRAPLYLAAAGGHTEITELLNRHIRIPSPADASFADSTPDLILTPESSIAPQQFGCFVDCADVNGDGYDDCLVTASNYNNDQGRVYLYYGGPSMDARPDKIFTGEAAGDLFGEAAALGDVNGDHFADVIIAAIRYDNKRGRVLIYYGGPDMDTDPDVILEGEQGTSGRFGRVIDTADIDRDGYADVVVNALFYAAEAGRAYLYYGGNPMNTQPAKIFDGENPGDMFGREMDMGGDVNGDGYGDIIFGCRAWNNLRGRAYLYYGGPRDSMDSTCDKIFTGESAEDEFGSSVCLFDVDKDGYADVMIGARKYSKNTPRSFEGLMYMYWGGPAIALDADLIFEGEKGVGGCLGGDSIKCGHFNGDSYPDIMVSAWGYRTSQGRVCLYYGGSRASIDTVCDHTFTGETGTEASMYGVRNAIGDFNGDKRSDLLVGAPWYPSGNRLGRAYVYYTKPFPPGRQRNPAKPAQHVPGSNRATLKLMEDMSDD